MKAIALPLVLAVLLAGCGDIDPLAQDEDGDGMVAGQERAGWRVRVDLEGRRVEYNVTSDPAVADTDGDGLPDSIELQYPGGLDPRAADTDKDGLTDCQEVLHRDAATCGQDGVAYDGGYGTTANNADSELGGRFYQLFADFEDTTGTVVAMTWGDGVADGREVSGYDVTTPDGVRRTVRTDPREADTDGDGLHDGEELHAFASDPTLEDTDLDGCKDGLDAFPGQAEEYRPGLQALDLAAGGSVEVRFNLAGRQATTGPQAIPAGPADATGLDAPFARQGACTVRAIGPWMLVQVLATRDGQAIDLTSATNGSAVSGFYWDPQRDRMSWQADGGAPFDGPVVLRGEAGTATLAPRVRLPHGAWAPTGADAAPSP